MKISEAEKLEVQNLLKMIRRASFDKFQGMEALALARAYSWLESLLVVAPPMPMPEPDQAKMEITEAPKVEKKDNGRTRRFKRNK